MVTPELSICGYPPRDWVEHPELLEACEKAVQLLTQETRKHQAALLVGLVRSNPQTIGRPFQNIALGLHQGREVFSQAKTLLPNYDIFEEERFFEPAQNSQIWEFGKTRIGLGICEDFWGKEGERGRCRYAVDFEKRIADLKPELLISMSASPYDRFHREKREKVHSAIAQRLEAPMVYVNQVGGQDDLLFDGQSFVLSRTGQVSLRAQAFSEDLQVVDLATVDSSQAQAPWTEIQEIRLGLVRGIRDYFHRTGFKRAILGLSGGIDSAVVAVLAQEALGNENILGIAMPAQVSSAHSLEDAQILAQRLKIKFEVRPIKFLYSTAQRSFTEFRGELAPLAHENLQSRLRGLTLMTLSNNDGALVLATGNKSEIALGYCTLYGDMCGGLAPIGDLYKTQVYALAQEINASRPDRPIPERSITKAPSAELRPDQKDEDSLPPYAVLDPVLEAYLEQNQSVQVLQDQWEKKAPQLPAGWVRDTLRKLEQNEYKRRQSAPILRVSPKAFGGGRRMPIAHKNPAW